jgi:DNA polymerase-3 subunit delta'
MDLVNSWLTARLGNGMQAKPQLARVAETWDKVNRAAAEVETYNLERRPFVFAVFSALADTAHV